MEIRVLGPLEVYDADRPIAVRRPMARALLTLLAAEPDRVVSSDRLVDGLWGESPPATAVKTLQTYILHLRSLLPSGAIVTDGSGYRLAIDPMDVDAVRFSAAVESGRDGLVADPRSAADLLAATLSSWRGTPYSDAEAETLRPLRTRLEDLRLQALADTVDARMRMGRHDGVLPELRSLLEAYPMREDLWGMYMLALYRSGRQAEALRAFADARRRLVEELGIEPGPELRSLEDRILAQDPGLLLERVPPPGEVVVERPSEVGADEPPPPGQRLATFVVAELLGTAASGQAVGADAAARIDSELIDSLAGELERLGGTVVLRDGSGISASFGIPVVREDDTYRAILAALHLADRVAERRVEIERSWGAAAVAVRAAVRTLPVIVPLSDQVDEILSPLRAMLTAAAWGTVVVDDHTVGLMGDLFSWEEAIPATSGDGALWRATGVRGQTDKARMGRRLRAPLMGRDAEMAAATEALLSLRRGIGGILLLSGDAGVGKTRLVAEMQAATRGERAAWLIGHCVSYAEATPYWPFRDLLRSWLDLGIDDTDLQARIALHHRLEESLPDDADALYPYLGGVLGIALEPDQARRLGVAAEALQYRTFEVLEAVLAGLADLGPVVLVIEDIHWADPTSILLIERLLALTERAALLVVLTTRHDPDHPSHRLTEVAKRRLPHLVREITLTSLHEDAQQAMLDALIGSTTLPATTVDRIVRLAEGNPFYVEELVGSMIDEGALVAAADGWAFDHEATVTVPETVEKVVQARIDRLDRPAHDLVTAASVLGRSFGLPLLQGVVGESGSVIEAVSDLLRLDLLVEARRWPQAEYLFKHALIQEAAYRTLPWARRAELHRFAAEWLEARHQENRDEVAGLLARHWLAAGDEDRAAAALVRAGDLARKDHALDEAIGYYRELLPILERRGDRRTMALALFKLALALHTALRFAESNTTYQRAFTVWDPPVTPAATATLRFAGPPLSSDPDPARSYNLQDIQLQMSLLDRLVERWPDDTIVPSLAEHWQISDDGLRYRFRLRSGLTWSDGRPLTAADVEYGVKRNLDPEEPGIGVALFYVLEGAQDHAQGRTTDPAAIGVEALDDRTVEFRLVAPAPYFLGMLNRPDAGPQPRHAIESGSEAWIAAEHEVVSGAYRFVSEGDGRMVLERRSDHQGSRIGNVRTVEWRRGEYRGLIDAYRSGEVDLVWIRANYDGEHLDHLPWDEVRLEPPAFLFYLVFDQRHIRTRDRRFRLALAHGIDRTAWRDQFPRHLTPATGGVVPPALSGHTPDIAPRFDPELGRKLLAEMGPISPVRIEGAAIPEHVFSLLIESVADMWRRHLGIEVDVVLGDPVASIPSDELSIDVFPSVWFPGYTDPEYFLRLLLHSESTANFGAFSHQPYDDLMESARRERNERSRLSLFHAADRMAVAELGAVIPLAYGRNISVVRPGIEGWWEFGKSWANFADLKVSLDP